MTSLITNTNDLYDVIIIGAGPAGLSMLSAIHNPDGHLTNARKRRSLWNRKLWNKKPSKQMKVCVVDPAGDWMNEWKGRFKSLGIDLLRSPAFATPDYYSNAAITEYAFKHNRQKELIEMELPRNACALTYGIASEGLMKLAKSKLFSDFCDDLAKSLPHTFLSGYAKQINRGNDNGTYDVSISVAGKKNASVITGKHVVFALGAASTPTIPKEVSWIHDCVDAKNPCVVHTFSWKKLNALQFFNEVIVVIGGGLSAVQAVLLAKKKGAKRVLHVSRRAIQTRFYDVSLDWLDPRIAWRTEKGKKVNNMFEFHNVPKLKRREFVRKARAGATVPPRYLELLKKAAKSGHVERYVDSIDTAEYFGCGLHGTDRTIHIKFKNSTPPVVANRIILATGAQTSVSKIQLLKDAITNFNLPVIDDLPDVDGYLQWGKEQFSVVGNLALLQLGPDSGNLSGARRSAELVANTLGSFDSYLEEGGVHDNFFSAFASESDDSSDDDSDASADSTTSCSVENEFHECDDDDKS